MTVEFASMCSGIEAASVAWESLGYEAKWFAEIEPFPSAVLAHRHPSVPNHGDMTKIVGRILSGAIPAPPVFIAGTPCQAFSVAGMREGLVDPRGALTIKYVEILDAADYVRTANGEDECVGVWENVPGVLSDKGNAFGCFLGALVGESEELQPPGGRWKDAGCVYGPQRTVAWRVLDAQYFGLAQRRRRVFVVASARAGFDPAAVLFESEGVRRDSPPRRVSAEGVAGTIAASTGGADENDARDGRLIDFGGNNTAGPIDVATARNACNSASGRLDFESETFVVHGTQDPEIRDEQVYNIGRKKGMENGVLSFQERGRPDGRCIDIGGDVAYALTSPGDGGRGHERNIHDGNSVRRLTPRECERLQGFPDDYTLIPWRGKPAEECPDGPRYKAIGNSKAIPVVRWIGRRLMEQIRNPST